MLEVNTQSPVDGAHRVMPICPRSIPYGYHTHFSFPLKSSSTSLRYYFIRHSMRAVDMAGLLMCRRHACWAGRTAVAIILLPRVPTALESSMCYCWCWHPAEEAMGADSLWAVILSGHDWLAPGPELTGPLKRLSTCCTA